MIQLPLFRERRRLPRPLVQGRTLLTPRQVWQLLGPWLQRSPRGCWVWTGARNSDGYAVIRDDDGRVVLLSRWILAHTVRRFRKGELACHGCDNPSCIRPHPDHTRHGTNSSNMREMYARYRRARRSQPVTFLEEAIAVAAGGVSSV